MSFFRNTGSALITALMLVVIVAASVTVVVTMERVLLYKTKQAEAVTQAFELTSGAEAWAYQFLSTYLNSSDEEVAQIHWPFVMPKLMMNNTKISGYLYDMQSLYNLNQVVVDVRGFARLIQYADPKISLTQALELARNVAQWQSKQVAEYSGQDDSAYYASQDPPYRAAYQAFADKSELRLVKGFDQALYDLLSPYLYTFPEKAASDININTATPASLIALSDKISPELATAIVAARDEKGGFRSLDEFFKLPAVKKSQVEAVRLSVRSEFFRVRTQVTYKKTSIRIDTCYEAKKEDNGNSKIRVLSRAVVPF